MCDNIRTKHHNHCGLYAREMELPKGWEAESHKHKFDHMSILAQGEVTVTTIEGATRLVAPAVIEVKAELVHSIYAHEDAVWFCIHATEKFELEHIHIGKA